MSQAAAPRVSLSVQWHITTECANRCRHCYLFDPRTYAAERAGTLDQAGLFAVLERFAEFERDWDAEVGHVALSGGDPLLRPEWEELAAELAARGKQVVLMGNPETLTPANLAALRRAGVRRFQLSLDGREATHDALRGPGSFRRTVEGFDRLADAGLRANAMMTVGAGNAGELVPLLEFAARHTRAWSFSFDLAAAVGNAAELEGSLGAGEVLALFRQYRQAARRLAEEGLPLRCREKPNLFRVLSVLEQGREVLHPAGAAAVGGCLAGWNGVAVLADGRVMACRRFPSVVGRLPEQPFAEIFLGSPELRRFRRASQYGACGGCRFFGLCRGCPAVAFGRTGQPRGAFPLCFRTLLESGSASTPARPAPVPEPPLDCPPEEEFELVAGHVSHLAVARSARHLRDPEYRKALLLLTLEGEKARFLQSPARWRADNGVRLGELESLCAFLMSGRHFAGSPLDVAKRPSFGE